MKVSFQSFFSEREFLKNPKSINNCTIIQICLSDGSFIEQKWDFFLQTKYDWMNLLFSFIVSHDFLLFIEGFNQYCCKTNKFQNSFAWDYWWETSQLTTTMQQLIWSYQKKKHLIPSMVFNWEAREQNSAWAEWCKLTPFVLW